MLEGPTKGHRDTPHPCNITQMVMTITGFTGCLLLLLSFRLAHTADWVLFDETAARFAKACSPSAAAASALCAQAPTVAVAVEAQPDFGNHSSSLLGLAWDYAGQLSAMRLHADASNLRSACLAHANHSAAAPAPWISPAAALAALAHDLRHARAYGPAIAALKEALAASPASPAPLLAFLAELQSCSGEALGALSSLARSRKAAAHGAFPPPSQEFAVENTLQELDLLRRALRLPQERLPRGVAAGLQKKYDGLTHAMLTAGPWRDALQLPHHFLPALPSAPWHSAQGVREVLTAAGSGKPWPRQALEAAQRILQAAAPALLGEYFTLRDGGHLEPETECIAEPRWLQQRDERASGNGVPLRWRAERGGWWVFTANAWWRRGLTLGCSELSPVACKAMGDIGALGLTVQRVGYSALWPGALLHPHYGLTNAVLKLHLGLKIPKTRQGRACAALTVGGETRPWEEGGVLFFDDSFLHSVAFEEEGECGGMGERVVLQVVLRHPLV